MLTDRWCGQCLDSKDAGRLGGRRTQLSLLSADTRLTVAQLKRYSTRTDSAPLHFSRCPSVERIHPLREPFRAWPRPEWRERGIDDSEMTAILTVRELAFLRGEAIQGRA